MRRDLSAEQAHLLAQELIAAAQRLGISQKLAEEVRAAGALTDADWEHAAERAAAVAAIRLNALIGDLGYGALPLERRPQVPPAPRQASRRAFQPPELFEDLPQLAVQPSAPARTYRLDWLSALVQLAEDNLGFAGARDISEAENAALGRILDRARLEGALMAPA